MSSQTTIQEILIQQQLNTAMQTQSINDANNKLSILKSNNHRKNYWISNKPYDIKFILSFKLYHANHHSSSTNDDITSNNNSKMIESQMINPNIMPRNQPQTLSSICQDIA